MMREALQGHLELVTQELALDPIRPEIEGPCEALLAQLRFASYAPPKSRIDEKELRTALEALQKVAPEECLDTTSRPGALARAAQELIASPQIEDFFDSNATLAPPSTPPVATAPVAKPPAAQETAKPQATKAVAKPPAPKEAAKPPATQASPRALAPARAAPPVAPPVAATPPPAATDPMAEIANAYDAIGGGARDRSAKVAPVPGQKPMSTRSAAPLISGQDFAKKMIALGAAAEIASFLPKLAQVPEQMRILTLEALYGAQATDEVRDIMTQMQSVF